MCLQKVRTINLDGKTVKLQIVSTLPFLVDAQWFCLQSPVSKFKSQCMGLSKWVVISTIQLDRVTLPATV